MSPIKFYRNDMNKLLLVGFLSLLLSGCSEPKKINMAEYGLKEEGTLYVKKVDAISAIYESVHYAMRDYSYPITSICIDFDYDGQKKTFCHKKYERKEAMYSYRTMPADYFMIDDESRPIQSNVDILNQLEKKLHQVANDHSVFDNLSELISKFK